MITQPSQAVKAVKLFAAKRDVRYYFNGVALYIENDRIVTVAATDGHCLSVVGREDTGSIIPVIVSNENLPTLITALDVALQAENPLVSVDEFKMFIGGYALPLVEGRFPDIRRVIPKLKRTPADAIGIQPDYIGKLKQFKAELVKNIPARSKKTVGMVMRCGAADESVRFDICSPHGLQDDAVVVITPIRL